MTRHRPGLPTTGKSADETAVTSANAEISSVADAVGELQRRLDQANEQLRQVNVMRATELEIGRLLVEAQRFSDAYLSRLEEQVHQILRKAEAKASQILLEATQEAQQLRRDAMQARLLDPSST